MPDVPFVDVGCLTAGEQWAKRVPGQNARLRGALAVFPPGLRRRMVGLPGSLHLDRGWGPAATAPVPRISERSSPRSARHALGDPGADSGGGLTTMLAAWSH